MTAPMNPFYFLFSFTLLLGIWLVLSSNNWLGVWTGLELNMYSFIPLLLTSNINQENEAAINYFLFQALASGLLLLSALSSQLTTYSPIFLFIALLLKLGMAPCHFWFPIVINSISWNMCWLLSTLQNISPIFLLITSLQPNTSCIPAIIAGINAMVGGLGGLNQTQLRAILAYSSIGHIGWILSGTLCNTYMSLWYFFIYLLLISSIIPIFSSAAIFINSTPMWNPTNSQLDNVLITLALLSLAGVPPSLGFFPNIFVISSLISNSMYFLSFILVVGSSINLYYYINISFNLFLSTNLSQPISTLHNLPPRLFMFSMLLSMSIVSAIITFPIIIM